MVKLSNKSRPKKEDGKDKKQNTFDSVNPICECQELTLNTIRRGILSINKRQGKGLKILTPKQIKDYQNLFHK